LANDARQEQEQAKTLWRRKVELARAMLQLTAQELLLVDMDRLGELLTRKDALIVQIEELDAALGELSVPQAALLPIQEEYGAVVRDILENERTFEDRVDKERSRLRAELRNLERETRLRRYLEGGRPKGGTFDLKR
jgi:hypothetical protein